MNTKIVWYAGLIFLPLCLLVPLVWWYRGISPTLFSVDAYFLDTLGSALKIIAFTSLVLAFLIRKAAKKSNILYVGEIILIETVGLSGLMLFYIGGSILWLFVLVIVVATGLYFIYPSQNQLLR